MGLLTSVQLAMVMASQARSFLCIIEVMSLTAASVCGAGLPWLAVERSMVLSAAPSLPHESEVVPTSSTRKQ